MDAIEAVRVGMTVVDASGATLGTVEDVMLGAPGARSDAPGSSDISRDAVAAIVGVNEQDVPDRIPEIADRMFRLGYAEVDGSDLLGGHSYVAGDSIERVDGDVVHLTFVQE